MKKAMRQVDLAGKTALLDRPSRAAELSSAAPVAVRDLRSTAPSADHDRSAHRRSAWLYEDLLN